MAQSMPDKRTRDPLVSWISTALVGACWMSRVPFVRWPFTLMFLLVWILYGTFKGLNAYRKETQQ